MSAIQLAEWFSNQQLAVLDSLRRQKLEERCDKLTKVLKSNGGAVSVRNLVNSHRFSRAEIDRITNQFPNRFAVKKEATGGRPSEILTIKAEN